MCNVVCIELHGVDRDGHFSNYIGLLLIFVNVKSLYFL